MNPKEARQIIATYLTGGKVPQPDLDAACRVAGSDVRFVRFVRQQHGASLRPITGCDLFLARAAEFADCNPKEREQEMPELREHVESCPACLAVFWRLRSLWDLIDDDASRRPRYMLGESIQVHLLANGGVVERGVGPRAAIAAPRVFATALGSRSRALEPDMSDETDFVLLSNQKVWEFTSPEFKCLISLELSTTDPDAIVLQCRCRPGPSIAESWDDRVQMEIRKRGSLFPMVRGSLAEFADRRIPLKPGEWSIRLHTGAVTSSDGWEIPLTITSEETQ